MRVVICMDSWKGSLSALEACERVGRGVASVLGDVELTLCPMADGGEGTLERVNRSSPGEMTFLEVTGPFADRRIRAPYLFWPEQKRALVEMAVCAGLPLLKENERDPMRATTLGVGELMADALRAGAEEMVLALGGSATVDGGTGMASALGWRFLDGEGRDLPAGGGALERLATVVPPTKPFPARLRVMCDVTNPLLGPRGAAAVFAPQKGAGPREVEMLEEGLSRLAEVLRRDLGVDVAGLAGGGAAGGIAAGAVAFWPDKPGAPPQGADAIQPLCSGCTARHNAVQRLQGRLSPSSGKTD